MRLGVSIAQEQTQTLKMTQQQRQSLALLQMNSYELEQHITEELKENPTLEIEYNKEIEWGSFIRAQKERYFEKEREYADTQEINPENFVEQPLTLSAHLDSEIVLLQLTEQERMIAQWIVRQIDENGYFRGDETIGAQQMGVTPMELAHVRAQMQAIEPKGIGASTLSECLCLQLSEEYAQQEWIVRLLHEDLQAIADRRISYLCKKYEQKEPKLVAVIEMIKRLDPKPGRQFSSDKPVFVLPDIIVEQMEDGSFELVDNATLPELYVSPYYEQLLRETEQGEVREFIEQRLQRALLLMRNIAQRKATIRTVAEHIILQQHVFFEQKGPLKALRQKDIAQSTGYHESTISRAISGKYMLTPRGMMAFSDFFVAAVQATDSEAISSAEIKLQLRRLVETEDKRKPLSDQKLSERLQALGLPVSRRTVTKYREELRIGSSAQRKQIGLD